MVKHYNTTYNLEKNFKKSIFIDYVKDYVNSFGLNKKSLFIAAHYAFAKRYSKNISKIRYILAHSHGATLFFKTLNDFPKQKVVFTIRDPRANYLSFKKIKMLFYGVLYQYESFILYKRLMKKNFDILTIRHEDMHLRYSDVKSKLISFLKIKNSSLIDECYFFNLPYDGSQSKISSSQKMQSTRPDKKFVNEIWKNELNSKEIIRVQSFFGNMMFLFKYKTMSSIKFVKVKKDKTEGLIIFGNEFNDLSKEMIEKRSGVKRKIFELLRSIYLIPFFGNYIIKSIIGSFYIFNMLKILFKVYTKPIYSG